MDNRISLKSLNLFFLLGVILFLTLGNLAQSLHFELGLIFTEYVLVLGYALLIIRVNRAHVADYIPTGAVKARDLLKTVVIVLLSLPIVMTLNLLSIYLLELFDLSLVYEMPVSSGFSGMILQFVIISVSAGICEEIFFRGVILHTYQDYFSLRQAIVISALLFGLYHFNVENILGPIYLGLVFGYLTVQTRSIIPAILGHMTNNGVAYLLAVMGSMIEIEAAEVTFDAATLLDTILSLSVVAIFSFGLILLLLRSFRRVDLSSRGSRPFRWVHLAPVFITGLIYIGYATYMLRG